jgi:hypothetical protein
MKAGRYAEACENFRESHELYPGNAALLNLALCHEALGQWARAWTHLKACLKQLPEDDPRRALAEAHFKAVERRVAMLTVLLSTGVAPPVDLQIDGRRVAETEVGVPLPLDPGPHEIRWNSGTALPQRMLVTLAEGERAVRTLGADPGHAAPPPPATPAPPVLRPEISGTESIRPGLERRQGGSTQRALGYTLGAVGIAGLSAAGVMGIMILDRQATVREHCPTKQSCDSEGIEAGDQGRTLVSATVTALAVGTVTLGSGIYLLVTDDSSNRGASLELGGRF